MTTRYNVIVARPGKDDKTFWHRVGTAWPREGGGMSVTFDSLPIPGKDGKTSCLIVDAEKDAKAQTKATPSKQSIREEISDEVPF